MNVIRETTQPEREEALLLMASLKAGMNVMEAEPRHLQAIFELMADGTDQPKDKRVYPQEHHVIPLDEQQRIDRERKERHARMFPAACTGPEEREYRRAHLPTWVYLPFGCGLALTVSGILYVVHALAGVAGVIGLMAIAALVASMLTLSIIAAKPEPKQK